MAVNNSQDERINARSPYYIEAGREAPAPIVVPPPIENNTPPTVTITASNETPVVGQTVTLTAVATDSDGTIVSYLWGGEGSGSTSSIEITSSTAISQQFSVVVTDDDGDTATDTITINWQEPVIQKPTVSVACGDTYNEAAFVGSKQYNLLVGDKIGTIEVELLEPFYTSYDIPVKFDLDWNGTTNTTGYVGSDEWGDGSPDDNTAYPSNKTTGTSVTVEKTAAIPDFATLTATVITNQNNGFTQPNDTYTFQLNCPDTEAVTTFYYTLTGTCTTGTTQFTYTDADGVTQTVTLANGETQLVSAQEDTVSVAICTGETEKGGQSFDLGQPEQEVDKTVEFNVWLDNSGSLSTEMDALRLMTNQELQSSFLAYYDDDTALYNGRVQYIEDPLPLTGTNKSEERFFKWASVEKRIVSSSKIVHLIYVDEAAPSYHISLRSNEQYLIGDNTLTTPYSTDISLLRNSLDNQDNFGDKLVVIFCIEKTSPPNNPTFGQFSHFIDNVSNGTNGFDGSKGLSDRSEVLFVRNVLPKKNSAYYHEVTINALRNLGFNI